SASILSGGAAMNWRFIAGESQSCQTAVGRFNRVSTPGSCDELHGGNCGPYIANRDSVCFPPSTMAPLVNPQVSQCRFSIFIRSQISSDSWNFSRAAIYPATRAGAQLCVNLYPDALSDASNVKVRISCR